MLQRQLWNGFFFLYFFLLMGFCWIKILMQSLLFWALAHHKPTVYSAFHHPVYPTSSDWTTTNPSTSFPPSFLLPQSHLLSNFAFPLDLCVMTWLGSDRRYTQDCLHREKERDRARERHRHECHTDRNNPCDKHKWMCTHFLSLSHATMHCHIQSHNESIWMNPNWTLCESNHSS